MRLRTVKTPIHVRDKMAAKYSSGFEIEDELSQKLVEQLRGLLKGKGLPTTGKKKVLIQRLVVDYYESKTAVKSEQSEESSEDMNFAKFSKELPPATNAKQVKEITSIRLKAKLLQGDIEAVIRTISELSEIENNKVKVKIRKIVRASCGICSVERSYNFITRRRGN